MFKQIVVEPKTYDNLSKLKELHRTKSISRLIDRLIDKFIERTPKQMMIEELNQILDKYHYELDNTDKEVFYGFIAVVKAQPDKKLDVLQGQLDVIKSKKIQKQL